MMDGTTGRKAWHTSSVLYGLKEARFDEVKRTLTRISKRTGTFTDVMSGPWKSHGGFALGSACFGIVTPRILLLCGVVNDM